MKIAMLGSGNVATFLSKALIQVGHPITQVWSRNPNNAIALALEIGSDSIVDISLILPETNIVIIAVNDDGIENVAAQIPKHSNQLILHTSGTTPLLVLQNYTLNCGVLYPLQTFSKQANVDFSVIPLCIEGSNLGVLTQIKILAAQLSNNVNEVNSQQRALLHISAVFACNFTNHFYHIAQQILENNGLNFDLLRPLIQQTTDKVMKSKPSEVQTGPAKRNDEQTMLKHLAILQDQPMWQELYVKLSQDIVKIYQPSSSSAK